MECVAQGTGLQRGSRRTRGNRALWEDEEQTAERSGHENGERETCLEARNWVSRPLMRDSGAFESGSS